jgi:hypothetical protein
VNFANFPRHTFHAVRTAERNFCARRAHGRGEKFESRAAEARARRGRFMRNAPKRQEGF